MPTEILMPALSPTMEEGTLAKWLVSEGDTVSSGDLLAEIETDKATMEFEAVDEGTVAKLLVAEGTEGVKVNSPIAVLLAEGESADEIETAGTASDDTGQETSPTTESAPPAAATDTTTSERPSGPGDGHRIFASPLARRIARERSLDLSGIKGSGPRGRIIKRDVEKAEESASRQPTEGQVAPAKIAQPSRVPPSSADAEQILRAYSDREFVEIKLDGMRRTIAARLSEAKATIPHFYLRRDIHLDTLLAFRSDLNAQLSARNVKLSVNDFIIKACGVALQQVPAANAIWAGDRIARLVPSDIAVAVAIDGGLFTPVIKDVHTKTLSAISTEIKDLAARARDRKLKPEEYEGGSFAISNLGMFGIDDFDAVINPPHGAILAVGAGSKRPVVGQDEEMTVATVMSLTLSVDHRVIDGALGAELLAAIKDNLENPLSMLA